MTLTADDLTKINNLIRTQRDRKRINTSRKSVIINPQSLVKGEVTTFGTYDFNTTFTKAPDIVFGQARSPALDRLKGVLVVQPIVYNWVVQSGGVTGFVLGLYALTSVPVGLTQHTISWNATGNASYYKAERVDDAWEASYTSSTASYLATNPGTTGEQVA